MSRPRRMRTDLPRTTCGEIRALVTTAQTRLQAEPESVEEWKAIAKALRSALNASLQHLEARTARAAQKAGAA